MSLVDLGVAVALGGLFVAAALIAFASGSSARSAGTDVHRRADALSASIEDTAARLERGAEPEPARNHAS